MLNAFDNSLHEDLLEDLGPWTHIDSNLIAKLVWLNLVISKLIFHPHQ